MTILNIVTIVKDSIIDTGILVTKDVPAKEEDRTLGEIQILMNLWHLIIYLQESLMSK